jgi:DNA ligase (NAD+)
VGNSREASAEERIATLRALLRRANRAYYADAAPIMTDREFDELLAELADLESRHPDLDDPTARPGGWGASRSRASRPSPTRCPMLSIDNTYDADEVRAWVARVRKGLGPTAPDAGDSGLFGDGGEPLPVSFVCEPKIDGVALSLRYENGTLARALTRGDGEKGDDVTHAARTIRAIPLVLETPDTTPDTPDDTPAVLEIRGEVFIPRPEFERINADREANGLDPFMNPRNACAGTIKQLDPRAIAERRLVFIAHGRGEVSDEGFAGSYSAFRDRIAAMGVPVSPHATVAADADAIMHAIERFEERRHDLDYDTDGMVVRVDSFAAAGQPGHDEQEPAVDRRVQVRRRAQAHVLTAVEHQVGKTGKITPRAVMEPVLLAGTTVRHASLHNFGLIRKKDIRVGDTVLVEKAGEIIPYVVEPVLGERPGDAEADHAPRRVPRLRGACRDRDRGGDRLPPRTATAGLDPENETARRCVNPECPAQLREKLVWFVGRNQMDIDGLGEQTIDQILSTASPPAPQRRRQGLVRREKRSGPTPPRMRRPSPSPSRSGASRTSSACPSTAIAARARPHGREEAREHARGDRGREVARARPRAGRAGDPARRHLDRQGARARLPGSRRAARGARRAADAQGVQHDVRGPARADQRVARQARRGLRDGARARHRARRARLPAQRGGAEDVPRAARGRRRPDEQGLPSPPGARAATAGTAPSPARPSS